jgi:hypothetical protein
VQLGLNAFARYNAVKRTLDKAERLFKSIM